MLAIGTYATKNYCYALEAQAPLVVASLRYAQIDPKEVMFIFAGDNSKEAAAGFREHAKRLEVMGVRCVQLKLNVSCNANGSHVKESNLVIARLQAAAIDEARIAGANLYWSLEADVLPQPKALRTLMGTLELDPGWYDVAMATYPNEAFLGGRGTPRNWILPNVYSDEKEVPADLRAWLEYRSRRQADLAQRVVVKSDPKNAALKVETGEQPSQDEFEQWKRLDAELEACPPRGNVWQLNAERWRQRGWLDHAYPGMGLGGVVPVDWVGVGCTLFSERALNLINFTGYDGGCTQDLWICWRVLQPSGLRIATTTHAICSHVKMKVAQEPLMKDGKPVMKGSKPVMEEVRKPVIHFAHHEVGGERHGHLNNATQPWHGL